MSRSDRALVVCGIAGSLRRGSYNRALLRATQELAPKGMEIRIFDRRVGIPLFNQDTFVGKLAGWTRRLRREPETPSR